MRLSAAQYLNDFTPSIFKYEFDTVVHPFFGKILGKDPDAIIDIFNSVSCYLTFKKKYICI